MTKPLSAPLNVTGAAEDYPRLLSVHKKLPGGTQIALVHRPASGRLVVVVSEKDGSTLLYDSAKSGELRGYDAPEWPYPSDKGARALSVKEAIEVLKEAQKDLPKAEPVLMRGQWAGKLTIDPEVSDHHKRLTLTLTRKLASYGTLTITGNNWAWAWTFERKGQWFGNATSRAGHSLKSLREAIEAGYAAALGLVKDACGVRDTQRRAGRDAEYAAKKPIKLPKDKAVNLDRFKVPAGTKRPKKTADGKPSCDGCPDSAPKAASRKGKKAVVTTTQDLGQVAKAIQKDAVAVEKAADKPADNEWSVDRVIDAFTNWGFLWPVADLIRDYAQGDLAPHDKPLSLMDFVKLARERAHELLSGNSYGEDDQLWKDVEVALKALPHALATGPALLGRTYNLIKYAEAAASSPRCEGNAQKEALAQIAKARDAYDTARQAFIDGKDSAGLKAMKKAAEWLGLSAAKVAASCKGGQATLLGHHGKDHGTPPATKPTAAPSDKPKRGRPRKADGTPAPQAPAQATGKTGGKARGGKKAAATEASVADKDALLMSVVTAAIQQSVAAARAQ